jgi:hypothetical protein
MEEQGLSGGARRAGGHPRPPPREEARLGEGHRGGALLVFILPHGRHRHQRGRSQPRPPCLHRDLG